MAGFHIFHLFASFAEYKSHFKADWKASELQRYETSFRAFNHWNACLDSFCMSSQQNWLQGDYPLVASMKWVDFVASPLGSYSSQNPCCGWHNPELLSYTVAMNQFLNSAEQVLPLWNESNWLIIL